MSGVLVDTNILVYAYYPAGDPRSEKAKAVLEERGDRGDGFVSVQNLAELSAFCLNKAKPPVSVPGVRATLDSVEALFSMVRPGSETVRSALHAVEKHRLSFWDALIWAQAKENGLDEILTEDMQDGQVVEGVRIRNPLR